MQLDLGRLSAAGVPLRGSVRLSDGPRPGERRSLAADGIRFPEPIEVEGRAWREGERVVVQARLSGHVSLECGRCLAPVTHDIVLDFVARFDPQPPPAAPAGEGEDDEDGLRIDEDELDVSFLAAGTTSLDVDEIVREQVLLDLPVRPLCGPGCRGLCARCGADLNAGTCACEDEEPRDLRLQALVELRKRLKGE